MAVNYDSCRISHIGITYRDLNNWKKARDFYGGSFRAKLTLDKTSPASEMQHFGEVGETQVAGFSWGGSGLFDIELLHFSGKTIPEGAVHHIGIGHDRSEEMVEIIEGHNVKVFHKERQGKPTYYYLADPYSGLLLEITPLQKELDGKEGIMFERFGITYPDRKALDDATLFYADNFGAEKVEEKIVSACEIELLFPGCGEAYIYSLKFGKVFFDLSHFLGKSRPGGAVNHIAIKKKEEGAKAAFIEQLKAGQKENLCPIMETNPSNHFIREPYSGMLIEIK